jgi:steroid 5-alpha reductase family enzyme
MTLWYCIALYKKDNSIVDIAWGIGFLLLAWYTFAQSSQHGNLQIAVTLLVTIWAIRLSYHIYKRNNGKKEDPRYAAWRKSWKWVKTRSFFQVFMLQGIILLVICYPVIFINSAPAQDLHLLAYTGIVVWLFGFIFESVGDWQLKQFLSQPKNKGKIMQSGLWHYTRHPNYFGESLMWWGMFLLCLSLANGWITIISPLLLTYLLLYVSGVPMAEQNFKGNKEFEAYKKRTNAFFPGF